MRKQFVIIVSLCTLLISCKSEYDKLEAYYNTTIALHKNISDSLVAFCKTYNREVILRKTGVKEKAISFQVFFDSEATYYPVYFDSAFNRHDPNQDKTLQFDVPVSAIRAFAQSAYKAISSDKTQTFFSGAWNSKLQLGTQGDSQYGILVSADTSIYRDCVKRLSANACLTERTIP